MKNYWALVKWVLNAKHSLFSFKIKNTFSVAKNPHKSDSVLPGHRKLLISLTGWRKVKRLETTALFILFSWIPELASVDGPEFRKIKLTVIKKSSKSYRVFHEVVKEIRVCKRFVFHSQVMWLYHGKVMEEDLEIAWGTCCVV